MDMMIDMNKTLKSINNADSLAYFLEWDNDSKKG